jgi:ParB-like nuclease domain
MTENWPIRDVDLSMVVEFDENPNEMSDDMFSALVEEIAESGWLVPIQVAGPEPDGTYRLIGGHHRKKAALVLGLERVPAVVVDPEVFNKDRQEIQVIKQNVLHGELNPEKFTQLFNRLSSKYDVEVLRRMMAFTKQDAFRKVYLDARKGLPDEIAAKLDEVREELKTVDDLSIVLNRLFTEYGNTLDSNFMVFVHGGKENIMVQLQSPGSWTRIKKFADWCFENGLRMDEELMARTEWPNVNESPNRMVYAGPGVRDDAEAQAVR